MAILSDTSLILNHIKNCFIYGDDSGICEMIIEKEMIGNYNLQLVLDNKFSFAIADTSTVQFRSNSPELNIMDTKPVFSRKLSSDVKIKEFEEEKALIPDNHKFLDTGQWPKNLNEKEVEEFFGCIKEVPSKRPVLKSLLSQMLDETDLNDLVSINIFAQYAKFSALSYSKTINPRSKVVVIKSTAIPDSDPNRMLRDFNIYFWDYLNQRDRSNPIILRPLSDTKVSDFIGLACWKYTDEDRSPPIAEKNLVNKFQLYMFEDNDDLDLDFGCLHRDDPIYKYQFTNLAILECMASGRRKLSSSSTVTVDSSFVTHSHMERFAMQGFHGIDGDNVVDRISTSNSSDYSDDSILIQVQLAHGLSKFRFPPDTTMEQIIQRTVTKRHLQQHGNNCKYRLELASDPGKEIDVNKTLSEIADPSFVLIRDMSRRKPAIPDSISEESSDFLLNMIDSLQPQKYSIHLKQTLRKSEATLMVSGHRIEIDVHINKMPFLIKPKKVRIPIAFMADCVLDTHGLTDSDRSDRKTTVKFIHLKRKSAMVKSLKWSGEYENSLDSESSSGKSHGRNDLNTVVAPMTVISHQNLVSELTTHSISCVWTKARRIYDQVMAVLNIKSSVVRREYLNLSR